MLAACGGAATSSTPSAGSQAADAVVDDGAALGFADLDGDDVAEDVSDDVGGDDASASDLDGADDDASGDDMATFATPIGAAGVVELAVSGDSVALIDVQLSDGWDETNRSTSDGEIELDLRSATTSIDVDAEIESNTVLEVEVDTEWQMAAGAYIESTIAGDVTLVFDGDAVTVAAIDLVDGWTVTGQSGDDDEITVTLTHASSGDTVRIDAEFDDGRGDIDTRTRITIAG